VELFRLNPLAYLKEESEKSGITQMRFNPEKVSPKNSVKNYMSAKAAHLFVMYTLQPRAFGDRNCTPKKFGVGADCQS
jgi:hypothetical protein